MTACQIVDKAIRDIVQHRRSCCTYYMKLSALSGKNGDLYYKTHQPEEPGWQLKYTKATLKCSIIYRYAKKTPKRQDLLQAVAFIPANNCKCSTFYWVSNNDCYIGRGNTKRDWLICSRVASDKCNISRRVTIVVINILKYKRKKTYSVIQYWFRRI
jgi:hypothetical protein